MRLRRLISSFLFVFLTASQAFAALQADATWEVRTTGTANAGACFDPGGTGTDFTQQNSPALSLTDLAMTAGTTTLTSATGGFLATHVDNCIYINGCGSGANCFTTGSFEITARTDTNTVTLDRTACSASGNCAGGTGNVGGALSDPNVISDDVVAGNKIYIKSGTYTVKLGATDLGTAQAHISWDGYTVSRDDVTLGDNRPFFDCQSTLANGITTSDGRNDFYNLRTGNCTGDGVSFLGSNTGSFINVSSNNNTGSGFDDSDASGTSGIFHNVEAGNNGAQGIGPSGATSATCSAIGSFIHDNSSSGIGCQGAGAAIFTILEGNGADANDDSGTCVNSIAHNNTGAGVDGFDEVAESDVVKNCAATNNGGVGFRGSSAGEDTIFNFNAYNGNTTSGVINLTMGKNDVTAAPSYTNAGAHDFTLATGSPYFGAGTPQSSVPGLSGDYAVNIGVDQDDERSKVTIYDTTIYDTTIN